MHAHNQPIGAALTFSPLGVSRAAAMAFFALLLVPFALGAGGAWVMMLFSRDWSWTGAIAPAVIAIVVGWNAYWWLHRISLSTTFDGTQLHWQTGFRSGSIEARRDPGHPLLLHDDRDLQL